MTVWPQGGIKVIRHIFACKICDHLDAIKRQVAGCRTLSDSSGLHFDGDGAAGAEFGLLGSGLCDVSDRYNHSCVMRALTPWLHHRKSACVVYNFGADHNIADVHGRIERSAESGADDSFGGKRL
jgi:hypothetical protein